MIELMYKVEIIKLGKKKNQKQPTAAFNGRIIFA